MRRRSPQSQQRKVSSWWTSVLESQSSNERRGAVLVLIAVCLLTLLAMMAFTIDVPYMQLVRTELRIATDASAKAGAEALRRTRDPEAAIQAALDIAALNTVAGKNLILNREDVVLGRSEIQSDGSYAFTAGTEPYNSVQVKSHLDSNSNNGAVNLFFGSIMGVNSFQPRQDAVAGQTIREVCLVLDRSHSMCFDLSGIDWQYPKGVKIPQYDQAPHPTNSRWAALVQAVRVYTDIISKQKLPPRVGLVTWGSEMKTSPPFPATIIESNLTTSMTNILNPLRGRGNQVMWGATNMSEGIDAGVKVLTAKDVNPLADKVMILMSDGVWNQGRDPILAARDAQKAGIVIHTVCLLSGKSEAVCKEVASITGGTYTFASNSAQLIAAFEKLAQQLGVTLIE